MFLICQNEVHRSPLKEVRKIRTKFFIIVSYFHKLTTDIVVATLLWVTWYSRSIIYLNLAEMQIQLLNRCS